MGAAMEACGDEHGQLRAAALQSAEVVWQRGVILKGNGLCHGICGNAYSFLTLFRLTGKEEHLQRAKAFVTLMDDPNLQRAVAQQPDPQRRVPGVPDSPRSLMEGSAGVLCFLLDVSSPEASRFPAWEL